MPHPNYHVSITPAAWATPGVAPYRDYYPVTLRNGSQLNLPIQPLPGGQEAIALLMSNQTPFAVETELASALGRLAAEFGPEVIAGIPTLGLAYARLVARDLGFPHYVALGNSRKFWYSDDLSVPVHSITSPGANKRLFLDPKLVERVSGKRTLIVDDVINTGGSAAAAIELLSIAGAQLIGLCVILIEGDAWHRPLSAFAPDWPGRVRGLGRIPLFKNSAAGWIPLDAPPAGD
jgi:adenine/guanine phosphoribosyltransferase-like PRPP-binding protein